MDEQADEYTSDASWYGWGTSPRMRGKPGVWV